MSEPVREYCREWLPAEDRYCNERAEFLLWGRLIPGDGLGPRCYNHAAVWVDYSALRPNSDYALFDLRGLVREAPP